MMEEEKVVEEELDLEEELEKAEEREVKVREARMALVATEILNGVVIMYEFLPIEEARAMIAELRKNAI